MKKNGILNSDISKVLADMGHTDQITIADCGLPVPKTVNKIDISLKMRTPKFIEVFEEVLGDMEIEKIFLAEEIINKNSSVHQEVLNIIGKNIIIEYLPHEEFKKMTLESKAVIRTGEVTPFANVILQSNVIF